MNSRFDSELDFQTAVFSFICPSSLNFLLYLGYKALCSMQVENLTVHRKALLIRSSLQKDMSLDSSNLSPISVSCIQWVPIQYCLSRKQACSLKEISVIPLVCALARVTKCSWLDSAYLAGQPGWSAKSSWTHKMEEVGRYLWRSFCRHSTGTSRVSCPRLCQAAFEYLQGWWLQLTDHCGEKLENKRQQNKGI